MGSRMDYRASLYTLSRDTTEIAETAVYLEEAQQRNFQRWPILGEYVWPNNFIGKTYAEEVAYLGQWLDERLVWMDANFLSELRRVPDLAGQLTAVEERPAAVPPSFALGQNYPNPFNGATAIHFSLAAPGAVDLGVYDLAGQKVATLAQGARQAGEHAVRWNGADDRGRELASGIYLYRLRTFAHEQTKKLLLLR